MKNTIPASKSKSKIKPLQDKVKYLEQENSDLLEEMYRAGIKTRPTIMSQIEEKEADTYKTIQYLIKNCENTTGRKFHSISLANQIFSKA